MMPVTKRILIGLVRRTPVISLLVLLAPLAAAQQPAQPPGATARGRVVAADGTPIARARVRLGAPLRDRSGALVRTVVTDAGGTFELRNIPTGSFRIEVELPRSRGGLSTPIVYYPGALTRDEAVRVEFTAGQLVSDLTIVIPKLTEHTLTVRLGPRDKSITQVAVSVLRTAPLMARRLELDPQDVATISGMTPGRYVVAARASSKRKQFAAFEVIDFVEDAANVLLRLQPTGNIAGQIVAERGARPPLSGVSVGAAWTHKGTDVTPLAPEHVSVATNGAFRINGLFGTRELRLNGLDPDWVVRSVRQKRRDVTNSGVEIVPGRTIEVTVVVARR